MVLLTTRLLRPFNDENAQRGRTGHWYPIGSPRRTTNKRCGGDRRPARHATGSVRSDLTAFGGAAEGARSIDEVVKKLSRLRKRVSPILLCFSCFGTGLVRDEGNFSRLEIEDARLVMRGLSSPRGSGRLSGRCREASQLFLSSWLSIPNRLPDASLLRRARPLHLRAVPSCALVLRKGRAPSFVRLKVATLVEVGPRLHPVGSTGKRSRGGLLEVHGVRSVSFPLLA